MRQCRNGARPRRTGRPARGWKVPRAEVAAMEPVHGGRDDLGPSRCGLRSTARRNGARPRRTGRPRISWVARWISVPPQWSPSTEDGTTWLSTATCRSTRGRNGARPRRTGRHRVIGAPLGRHPAAMEPVHGGRDDVGRAAGRAAAVGAAMEPVHGGRDDRSHPDDRPCRLGAAMEPVHGGRDDCGPGSPTGSGRSRRNGARPRRTGRPSRSFSRSSTALSPQWSPSTEDGTTRWWPCAPAT